MMGLGAPTPPAGGGSGGPAVDETARAAAAAAQADATAALEGDAVDLVARDAAADAVAAVAAIPAGITKGLVRFRRTTSTAFTDGVEESALQNTARTAVGALSISGNTIIVGSGVSFLLILVTENASTQTRSVVLKKNGANMDSRQQAFATSSSFTIMQSVEVTAGDVIEVLYVAGSWTSGAPATLNNIVVQAF